MITIDRPMKILCSYWYFKKADFEELTTRIFGDQPPLIFADSGAVTAYSKGEEITVEEYTEWVLKWEDYFTVYANLDVKGDVDQGLKHQRYMEDQGLSPMPVFHTGEDFSILDDFIAEYDYIGLGGVAGHHSTKSDILMRWFLKCFQKAQDKGNKYHGFGISTWDVLRSFPWYSVDSSSWGTGFRYGRVPLFNPRKGAWTYLVLGDRKSVYRHGHLIREYGFEPEEFSDRDKNTRKSNAALSALSYMRAEEWLWEYWGKKRPLYYMADSNTNMGNWSLAYEGISLFLVESKPNMGDVNRVEERRKQCQK